jgi:hypothetical protein
LGYFAEDDFLAGFGELDAEPDAEDDEDDGDDGAIDSRECSMMTPPMRPRSRTWLRVGRFMGVGWILLWAMPGLKPFWWEGRGGPGMMAWHS